MNFIPFPRAETKLFRTRTIRKLCLIKTSVDNGAKTERYASQFLHHRQLQVGAIAARDGRLFSKASPSTGRISLPIWEGKGSERTFTSAISHGCHDVVSVRDRRYRRWLVGQSVVLTKLCQCLARLVGKGRSLWSFSLCRGLPRFASILFATIQPRGGRGDGRRRYGSLRRLSRPSAMHELFLVSYLGGAISTARKPPTLYRAINRRETERKRGGRAMLMRTRYHDVPLCSQYRARPAKIGLWGTIHLGETREVLGWIGLETGMWAALCSCLRLSLTFPC